MDRRKFLIGCGVSAAIAGRQAGAQMPNGRILVLTSYPDELLHRFEAAFVAAHPGIRIEFLWKSGREALEILRQPGQGGVDVYWTPALRNFPRLRAAGLLRPLDLDRSGLPGRIGAQSLSDPDGMFEAFEVAGYGLTLNPAYLAAHRLPVPGQWQDLADPVYAGHLVLPNPAEVGFAPALIDIILQAEGWVAGWALVQRIASRATLAGRGPDILDAIVSGRRGIALTIDFLALNAIADGKPVQFVYPPRTAWQPAHVAIPAAARDPAAALTFVRFVLSEAGQRLLFHPDIRRHPVRPDLYAAAPAELRNPFAVGGFAYDSEAGQQRTGSVLALFEALIGRDPAGLASFWQRIEAASGADSALFARAACLPIDAERARALGRVFDNRGRDPAPAAALSTQWAAEISAQRQALLLERKA